jgi:hypothetical protein
MQNFLDPGLPQTEEELKADIQKANSLVQATSNKLEAMKSARFRKGVEVEPPEEAEVRIALAEQEELRQKLILQQTNIRAGTRVVSRLEATGRARQLVPDAEHQLSTVYFASLPLCFCCWQRRWRL